MAASSSLSLLSASEPDEARSSLPLPLRMHKPGQSAARCVERRALHRAWRRRKRPQLRVACASAPLSAHQAR
jgi:hypothetical protein